MLLYDALWRLRQSWFFLSCITLAYYAVRYRNYRRENQRLIDEIDRKHQQLERTARKCEMIRRKKVHCHRFFYASIRSKCHQATGTQ